MLTSLGKFKALRQALLFAAAAIICSAPMFAQEYDDDYLGERPERYVMVRYMEGVIKVRKWDYDEELTIGMPLGEGDAIESNGRAVLQLGDGTRIAFAEKTRLEIVVLFDDADGRTQAMFRMDYGRLRVASGPRSDAMILFDMPSGSASMGYRSNASIEAGADRKVELKVFSGAVTFRNKRGAISIPSGNRLTIYSENDILDRMRAFNTYEKTPFEAWAERHLEYQRAANNNYIPSEIRYYADSLDAHGDWVPIPDVGWCWRPRITIASWRPYWRGHWSPSRMGMTWVSYDPFGYVTHHYGRWGWIPSHGWYWIPGVYYSPAWVAWHVSDSFFGWAPLGYYNRPVYWGYHDWRHDCWNVIDIRYIHRRDIYAYTRWDRNISGRFPAHQPNRPLVSPWSRGPLIVSRHEFTNPNPNQFRNALTREVSSQRQKAYEAQAGRAVIVRRDVGSDGRPFEDVSARRPLAERPVMRQPLRGAETPRDGGRPASRPDSRQIGGRSDTGMGNDRADAPRALSGEAGRGRQFETPPPGRTANPPAHGGEGRQPNAQDGDGRQPGRTATPSPSSSETRQPSTSSGSSGRNAEARPSPAPASADRSSSRTSTPSAPSKPTPAPPPDRSRNSRR